MRTDYCGKINKKHISKIVSICGWVNKKRHIGKIIFLDVRDQEGIVQVVCLSKNKNVFKIAEKLKLEFCIQIFGTVKERLEINKNLNISTGEVEIIAFQIKILNISKKLPFDESNCESNKNLLKFRYLNIRKSKILNNLKTRHLIVKYIIKFLNCNNFWNIETPFLTSSTPEGARDYLVPSRIHLGKFYALPQSPQLFKQLLMMSGIDRYYQIAKCFRDEDLRSNRQPEFTQIDIEVSFINELKFCKIIEEMIKYLWLKIKQIKLKKIKKISYSESMKRFGTDKPDLRNPLELIDVCDYLKNLSFFKNFNFKNDRIVTIKIPNGMSLSYKKINFYKKKIMKYDIKIYDFIKIKNELVQKKHFKKTIFYNFDINIIKKIFFRNKIHKNDILIFIYSKKQKIHKWFEKIRDIIALDLKIINKLDWSFTWIVDFPMFKKDSNNNFTSMHHPFCAPKNNNILNLIKNPELSLSKSYDLIINGEEIGGGSVRINTKKMQETVFKIIGLNTKNNTQKFNFFLKSLCYGTPPHAGIALGLDRLTMILTNSLNISDVIAFPKTTSASCLMTGSPHKLNKIDLKDLGISTKKIKKKK
ncbi:MAG: aspartate--tRNA ligase [Buchnera aphidicola (Periphyllus acericola)]|uniref:aspartate--tRNA ligase n=1 Tax=Buchnera aphidicola TaxID=9 RepID=UPI0030D4A4B7|nr:aspartate--tRNA ligase [Buchnera aphidicola (Periphyllus acericola)]